MDTKINTRKEVTESRKKIKGKIFFEQNFHFYYNSLAL